MAAKRLACSSKADLSALLYYPDGLRFEFALCPASSSAGYTNFTLAALWSV